MTTIDELMLIRKHILDSHQAVWECSNDPDNDNRWLTLGVEAGKGCEIIKLLNKLIEEKSKKKE